MKTLTFVDTNTNTNAAANADTKGCIIALCEHCFGELMIQYINVLQYLLLIYQYDNVPINKSSSKI